MLPIDTTSIRAVLSRSQIVPLSAQISLAAQGSSSNLWHVSDVTQQHRWMLKCPRMESAERGILEFWQTQGQAIDHDVLVLPLEQFEAAENVPAGAWLLPYIKSDKPTDPLLAQAKTLALLHHSSLMWSLKNQPGELSRSVIGCLKEWIFPWLKRCESCQKAQDQQLYRHLFAEYQMLCDQGEGPVVAHTPILCHRDLVPENWLYHMSNDAVTAYLIDWEWADWYHPAWDLAYWTAEIPQFWGATHFLPLHQWHDYQQKALRLYQEAASEISVELLHDDIQRIRPWINLGCLSWGLWKVQQISRGQNSDLHHYNLSLSSQKAWDFYHLIPSLCRYLTVVP